MKVLMISTDRTIGDPNSASAQRMIAYAERMESLHIVLFSRRGDNLTASQLSKQCWVYPTQSLVRLMYIYDAIRIIRRILRVSLPSVITTQDPFETGVAGLFGAWWYGIPFHVQIHTDIGSPYFKSTILNSLRLVLSKIVIRRADAFRVVSERISSTLHVRYGIPFDRITILPMWVDVPMYSSAEPDKEAVARWETFSVRILMASRLTEEKNIFLALHAVTRLSKIYPDIGLIIVGEGPLKEKMQKEARESNVVFEGWTDNLAGYYKATDIFLLTSDYEGYGRTLIEAAAAGCALVTTDVGIAKTVIRHEKEAHVCAVRNEECIAHALEMLITNPEERVHYGKRAHQRVEETHISYDTYIEKYIESLTI